MAVTRYACDDVGRGSKLSYWNEVLRDVYSLSLELSPVAPNGFDMTMESTGIDDLRLSRATLSAAQLANVPELRRRPGGRTYHLEIPSTRQHVTWDDGDCWLEPGDIVLLRSDKTCHSITARPFTAVALAIPEDILNQYLPDPERMVGKVFSRKDAVCGAASDLMLALWEVSDAGLLPELGGKLSRNLLEVLASACHASGDSRRQTASPASALAARIRRHADQHIRDPDLTVESIASAFAITPRYIQMLFRAQGEPLWSYIRRRRLEGCRTALLDPLWRDRSITAIAFAWGFNSMAHFTRLFREAYGVAPGVLRKQG